nr:uncharacterized protein LOC128688167 [Cherax quadricarinatus]
MRSAVMFLLTAALTLLMLQESECTVSFAALKALKYIGLAKLKKGILGSSENSESGLKGPGSIRDLVDSSYDHRHNFGPALYTSGGPPTYYVGGSPSGYYGGGPAFYIVPAAYFDSYHGRGKRDTQVVAAGPVPGTQERIPIDSFQEGQEEEYFGVVGKLDADGCVLRLVCELAGVPASSLTHDERVIMAVFDDTPEALANTQAGARLRSWKATYEQAVWLGRRSTNPSQSCASVYKTCPVSAKQLMLVFSSAEKNQAKKSSH